MESLANENLINKTSPTNVYRISVEEKQNASFDNETFELPIYMQFNDAHVISIAVYSVLMVISAVGNITVFATIVKFRMKARLNRVNLFLLHLAIADLFVTFLMMPLEIGWAATVSWTAGDALCRVMSFFRIFGLYLSGFLLVCISLDRYFAVLKPLALPEANRRGRYMLYSAWICSVACSLPQAAIFHVEKHPKVQWFEQCVTFGSFSSKTAELAYSVFGFVFMYGFPLAMIIFCYTCILYEIFRINNLNKTGDDLRRSNMGALGRAKIRTLKMTVVIVSTFFLCWTPYNIMSLWYWIDKDSAMQVDQRIQKMLFLFACTNSCVNPMVYGLFHIRTKKTTETPRYQPNNCRLQRLDKPPYKVRIRWTPRECLCAASSGSPISSTSGLRSRNMYEMNCVGPGRFVYMNGGNTHQPHNNDNTAGKNNLGIGNAKSHRYIGSLSQQQQNQLRKTNQNLANGKLNNNLNGDRHHSSSQRLDQVNGFGGSNLLLSHRLDSMPMLSTATTPTNNGQGNISPFSHSCNMSRKKLYASFNLGSLNFSTPAGQQQQREEDAALYSPQSAEKLFAQHEDEAGDCDPNTSTTFVGNKI